LILASGTQTGTYGIVCPKEIVVNALGALSIGRPEAFHASEITKLAKIGILPIKV
jgi:hypothetical protein